MKTRISIGIILLLGLLLLKPTLDRKRDHRRTVQRIEAVAISDAQTDLENGTLLIQVYGGPVTTYDPVERNLQELYGIQYNRVAGCVVSPEQLTYADTYNAIALPAFEDMFGEDFQKKALLKSLAKP